MKSWKSSIKVRRNIRDEKTTKKGCLKNDPFAAIKRFSNIDPMRALQQISAIKFLLVLFVFVNVLTAQAQQLENTKVKNKITSFLNRSEELADYSLNGFTGKFTGNFVLIPEEIESGSKKDFPNYIFFLVKMSVTIDGFPKERNLIVIFNKNTKKVGGFIWSGYWMIKASKSFEDVFSNHSSVSKAEALSQVKAFAGLLLWSEGDKIGSAKIHKNTIKVELIRGKGVMGILQVKLGKSLNFKQIIITEPNGNKIGTFV